jgi:heat shock protein HtpX
VKIDFFEQQRRNKRKTIFLIFLFIILITILGFGFDLLYLDAKFPILTLIAFVFASIQSLISYYNGDKIVLFSLQARKPNPEILKEKQFLNVLQEMSVASGLPVPKAYIIEETSPNAFATGRDEAHSSVAVTTGLLDTMSREELQGVIAHEVGHIKNRDILTMTIVSALFGVIVLLSDWGRRYLFYGGSIRGKRRGKGGGILIIIVLILIIISPIIARLIAMAISRAREYMADAASAQFTRNPKALASALEKIANHYDKVVDKATQGTAHLFIADPLNKAVNKKEGRFADLFSTHPPIWNRIRILKQMANIYEKKD